ncbi:carboxypeptidase A4-like [Tetranychus urticae]|nr:carboxypeptidase A4-like [Tetranychus urticae]
MDLKNAYSPGRFHSAEFRLDYYHTYEEINDYMSYLQTKYPDMVEVINFGETYEFHKINGLKIGKKSNDTKPAIWIDAGIHAREWIAPATAVYMMYKLTEKHEAEPIIGQLVEKFDWYIIPIVNPDGYMYTWWSNRLWRKNRALPKAVPIRYPWNLFEECIGTDPNRNFDIDFGGYSTSPNPCSEMFKGDKAFSEKESQAVRDGVQKLGKSLKVFLTLHSYSQLWMIPHAFTTQHSPHHEELYEILKNVSASVKQVHGETYRFGPMATTIYPCSGSSPDWVYSRVGIKYSFIVELRDKGEHGFILPRDYILPTAEETWEGVKTLVDLIKLDE